MPPWHSLSSAKGLSFDLQGLLAAGTIAARNRMSLHLYRYLGFAALALLLVGCDPSRPPSTSAAPQPQATAPALPQPAARLPPRLAPQQSVQQRQVQQLIDQVEKAYAQGDADYRKGRLPEAKSAFDHAVDLMLTSGIDIKSDPTAAGGIRPRRGPGQLAGDGRPQAGQRLRAQG